MTPGEICPARLWRNGAGAFSQFTLSISLAVRFSSPSGLGKHPGQGRFVSGTPESYRDAIVGDFGPRQSIWCKVWGPWGGEPQVALLQGIDDHGFAFHRISRWQLDDDNRG